MTSDRCPTCDKPRAGDVAVSHADGCSCPDCLSVCWRDWGVLCEPADWRARAIAAERSVADVSEELDLLRSDIAAHLPAYDIATQGGEPEHANPREVVEYAGDELRRASKDAARWRKVAPLIANLHRAALIGASHTELIAAVAEVTAATQEPTP